ncbi:DUF1194 domain-containing protein [Mesorhizobium caraganae]|uniref:DUF1194 domain-containing protein n=1 Tax=Mesorhizobium caraganae TaxID=483206 RepID=UPI00193ABB10|nr:DUF1194 domain-containing protein [Mesorhizobium caraganae]MBM2713513.1 DUF1194 domain-containing protein [Mesorhizobium caraganae]
MLSFAAFGAGLLRILLTVFQTVHCNSHTNCLCPREVGDNVLLEDPINEVDVAIVLAADMSGSINQIEAKLQRESYAAALESATVLKVIKEGMHGKIAVTFVEWSSRGSLETRVGWTILSDANDAAAIAEALRKNSERLRSGPHGSKTSISYAIDASVDAFDKLPVPTLRRIIDISGDGSNNDGSSVEDSRQRALRKGIVINGLPIGADVENGETTTEYYERHVIGGPGSFVIPADSAAAFQSAIIKKLIREMSSASGKAHC